MTVFLSLLQPLLFPVIEDALLTCRLMLLENDVVKKSRHTIVSDREQVTAAYFFSSWVEINKTGEVQKLFSRLRLHGDPRPVSQPRPLVGMATKMWGRLFVSRDSPNLMLACQL